MGNRTKALPELTGIAHVYREIRYHEFSRQAIGILLIARFLAIGVRRLKVCTGRVQRLPW